MSKQPPSVSSRIPGFYREHVEERLRTMLETGLLSEDSVRHLQDGGRLTLEVADRMSENVIGVHGLPLAIALNFRVNNNDVLVPMAVAAWPIASLALAPSAPKLMPAMVIGILSSIGRAAWRAPSVTSVAQRSR